MLSWRSLMLASVALLGCSADGPVGSDSAEPIYVGPVVSVYQSPSGYGSFVLARDTSLAPENVVIVHVSHLAAGPTSLRWADGRFARWEDIAVGQTVSVWTNGAEMLSLPPQAHAIRVTIESR